MRQRAIQTLAAVTALGLSSSAHAYSDQDRFALASEKGGGAGRYFTGSPADGFGCSVCHTGGTAPRVQVRGLPENFVPGTTYDLELSWDNPMLSHSLNLEFVTEQGAAAGTLALPAETAIGAVERCDGKRDGEVATKLYAVGARQVLALADCGASLVRARWTAPQATEVTFAAAIVRSDSSAKPEGDGVAEISRTMLADGVSRTAEGGCATHDGKSSTSLWLLALLTLSSRARRLRRR